MGAIVGIIIFLFVPEIAAAGIIIVGTGDIGRCSILSINLIGATTKSAPAAGGRSPMFSSKNLGPPSPEWWAPET